MDDSTHDETARQATEAAVRAVVEAVEQSARVKAVGWDIRDARINWTPAMRARAAAEIPAMAERIRDYRRAVDLVALELAAKGYIRADEVERIVRDCAGGTR